MCSVVKQQYAFSTAAVLTCIEVLGRMRRLLQQRIPCLVVGAGHVRADEHVHAWMLGHSLREIRERAAKPAYEHTIAELADFEEKAYPNPFCTTDVA